MNRSGINFPSLSLTLAALIASQSLLQPHDAVLWMLTISLVSGSVITSSKNCQTWQLCSVCGDIKDLQAGFVMTRKQVSFRQRCTISSCVTGNQTCYLSREDRQSPALLLATTNGYFTWEVADLQVYLCHKNTKL